ncbi:hypothetical protein GF362_01735 [Candidatus Dojkabacteria bacterium]|nr:hypothetical protein [Candidatus Dojkabacteria bacterium]
MIPVSEEIETDTLVQTGVAIANYVLLGLILLVANVSLNNFERIMLLINRIKKKYRNKNKRNFDSNWK